MLSIIVIFAKTWLCKLVINAFFLVYCGNLTSLLFISIAHKVSFTSLMMSECCGGIFDSQIIRLICKTYSQTIHFYIYGRNVRFRIFVNIKLVSIIAFFC
jgi:hypothetical protein